MRILLDAHASGPRLGKILRKRGHDVLAVAEHPSLEGMDDEPLLELAAAQERIVVTHNVRDFVPMLVEWGELDRSHAGCVLIKDIDHSQFAMLARGLTALFEARPDQAGWTDLALWLTPASPALTPEE